MNTTSKALIFLSAAALCACAGAKVFTAKGLVTGAPGKNVYPADQPGETSVLPRPYDGAPPMIPHSVEDLSIGRFDNDCHGCHEDGMELSEGHTATKIPASHYVNEYTKERYEYRVAGIRHNCLQCHAVQSSEAPPVGQMGG